MWQHAVNIILALVLVGASIFMFVFTNIAVSGIVMAAGVLIAGIAIWGLIDEIASNPLRLENGM